MPAVHVTHVSLAPQYGGGDRQLELLARGLAGHGIPQRAVVATRRAEENLNDIAGLEARRATTAFTALLASAGATQILHAHDARAARMLLQRRRFSGTPYVVTQRSLEMPADRPRMHRAYRRAGRLVAISQTVVEALRQFDASLTPVLIPSAAADVAADPWKVERLRRRYANRYLVGHVAPLREAHKGQRTLIALARRFRDTRPDIHFLIVGDGPDAEALRAEAAPLPNVEFTGWVDDVGNYLHAFDLFVYPSRVEALGGGLLEAMNVGLPVVATRVGGIPEIVTAPAGVLVPPDDVEALAAHVSALADDPERCRRMGEAGRRQAERFSVERMVQSYLRLYAALGYPDPAGATGARRPWRSGP